MAQVTVNTHVKAPVTKVWDSWNAFGDIHVFNPNLKGSHLLEGSAETGLGARPQCDFTDGKNHIREEITGYEPHNRLEFDIYDGTEPLKHAKATLLFSARTLNETDVTMTIKFTPKFGVFGALMVPMMKFQFKKALAGLLKANAAYVERGETVRIAD